MANLKTLKKRIQSIESTKKITSAMKLVSSSYFKKAEKSLYAAYPYTSGLCHLLDDLLKSKKVTTFPLVRGGKGKEHLLIVVSGNRGLCGGFNSAVGRQATQMIQQLLKEGKSVQVVCIGSKAKNSLSPSYRSLVIKEIHPTTQDAWALVSSFGEEVDLLFKRKKADSCSIIYTSFQSMLLSTIKTHSLIPYESDVTTNNKNLKKEGIDKKKTEILFGIEPSFSALLKKTALSNLKSQIYFSILESHASEESSRMVAMDGATKSSEEMITKLHLTYNRNRQAAITSELIEIIAGAESV
ncbi:ATP synthase F1 subunit gamma [Alphaproteobacteria bacterium]|nr:ATP synthase F1 subunit gamma [Alphaproteobacteria bacterium]